MARMPPPGDSEDDMPMLRWGDSLTTSIYRHRRLMERLAGVRRNPSQAYLMDMIQTLFRVIGLPTSGFYPRLIPLIARNVHLDLNLGGPRLHTPAHIAQRLLDAVNRTLLVERHRHEVGPLPALPMESSTNLDDDSTDEEIDDA